MRLSYRVSSYWYSLLSLCLISGWWQKGGQVTALICSR